MFSDIRRQHKERTVNGDQYAPKLPEQGSDNELDAYRKLVEEMTRIINVCEMRVCVCAVFKGNNFRGKTNVLRNRGVVGIGWSYKLREEQNHSQVKISKSSGEGAKCPLSNPLQTEVHVCMRGVI